MPRRRGILDEERDFVSLYEHAAGRFTTPPEWHRWCAMALIAAAVGDRVYLSRFKHAPMFPNLYVFLLGTPGQGKGHAIGFASALMTAAHAAYINPFPGSTTAAGFIDYLARLQAPGRKERPKDDAGTACWLLHKELANDIRAGELAKDFVQEMVGLYGGEGMRHEHNTRTSGNVDLATPCPNWTAGSTLEWFGLSIPPTMFDSGYSGRSIFSAPKRNYAERYVEPIYPDDYDDVIAHLRARLGVLVHTRGEMVLTDGAKRTERQWVFDRPAPDGPVEMTTWDRQHMLSLKLAMVLALAERTWPLEIQGRHLSTAQALVSQSTAATQMVSEAVRMGPALRGLALVRDVVKNAGTISMRALLTQSVRRGLSREDMREAVETLCAQGRADKMAVRGEIAVRWRGAPVWDGVETEGEA